jgi:hypothetical protein
VVSMQQVQDLELRNTEIDVSKSSLMWGSVGERCLLRTMGGQEHQRMVSPKTLSDLPDLGQRKGEHLHSMMLKPSLLVKTNGHRGNSKQSLGGFPVW